MTASLELAEAFIHAGELEEALNALTEHLHTHPADAAARRLRASVAARLPDRAREALADLDALETLTAADHLLRWRVLDNLGDADAALAALEASCTLDPDPRATELLLGVLLRRGEPDRALALLADLPKTWAWLGWSGDFYVLKGDDRVAAEHFCSALDELAKRESSALIAAQRARLLLRRADAYRRLRRFDDADADYAAAAAIIPDDPLIGFNRGLVACERGDLDSALLLCAAALDAAPDALRDHMRAALADPPYAALAILLDGNS